MKFKVVRSRNWQCQRTIDTQKNWYEHKDIILFYVLLSSLTRLPTRITIHSLMFLLKSCCIELHAFQSALVGDKAVKRSKSFQQLFRIKHMNTWSLLPTGLLFLKQKKIKKDYLLPSWIPLLSWDALCYIKDSYSLLSEWHGYIYAKLINIIYFGEKL